MHDLPRLARVITRVVSNTPVAREFYRLLFSWPADAPAPIPGQFLTIRAGDTPVPLLRRPFGFSQFSRDTGIGGILYQKRGTATRLMAALESGDSIDLLGPLGNAFPQPDSTGRRYLLGGGIGVGPVLFLAAALAEAAEREAPSGGPANPPDDQRVTVILGARGSEYLPDRAILPESRFIRYELCTDDGSEGSKGTVIDRLSELAVFSGTPHLYLCGPHAMLQAGADWADRYGASAWVSMEQTMGCAVGACLGCAVPVRSGGYKRVCTEGPVFPAGVIEWS